MSTRAVPRNAYTDAPELHPNLILGSLQLLFWLFFHPSAWRNHVARIDPDLRPDFCLAELRRTQWRNPALQRLLIQEYVVLSLLAGLLAGLIVWGSGQPAGNVAFSVTVIMAGGVAAGAAGGVGVIMAGSVAAGVAAGAAGGVAVIVADSVAAGAASGVAVIVAGSAVVGIAAGVAFGLAGSVASTVGTQTTTDSFARQIGGVVAGVAIGIMAIVIVVFVARVATNVVFDAVGSNVAFGVVFGLVSGGAAFSVAVGLHTSRWWRGVAFGVAFSVAFGVVVGVAFGVAGGATDSVAADVAGGIFFGAVTGVLFALPYVLAEHIAGPWAGAVAGALGSSGFWFASISPGSTLFWSALLLSLMSIPLGLTLSWWRPAVFYPLLAAWNLILYRADEQRTGDRPSLLRWHSAFWDEHQRLPLAGLGDHLVMVMERDPAEGQAAMGYLATSRQRWAAQAAQIELDARKLESCADVEAISNAHRRLGGSEPEGLVFPTTFPITFGGDHSLDVGALEGPASTLLRGFSRVSLDVQAALQQRSAYNQRLALSAVEDRLDALLRELTRSSDRYAVRFRPIANHWRRIIVDYVRELAEAVEARQEIDSPYVIGVPLTVQQEIFVGRADVAARIEQLLLDRRRPPLLLYGQRRMGKTSLLNNLGRLLPSTIIPLFVDLQGPASRASDHAGFLYSIAQGMVDSAGRQRDLALPPLPREILTADPFVRFDEWLSDVEEALGQNTALLALDEFEALDGAITRGRFVEEEVLGMLRHLIQHRPRFKVLLAGSHTLEELQRWASYLINVQVVQVSYLKEDEARQLVERPVKGFALRYEPEASQRVLDLVRRHPALVQLLCSEIVALKNEQPPAIRRLAHLGDVEAAVPRALQSGSFFFADIQRNQVDDAGLALLRFLAAQGEGAAVSREELVRQFPDDLDQTLDLLTRRELIEAVEDAYRFQVELIRRWFAQ